MYYHNLDYGLWINIAQRIDLKKNDNNNVFSLITCILLNS